MSEQPQPEAAAARAADLERQVAELRRELNTVAASEKAFRRMVQASNSVILTLDAEGNITFLNDFGLTFFGYSPNEIVGRNVVGTIVPEKDRNGFDLSAMIASLVREPESFAVNENENVRKNGERVWMAWSNRAVREESGRIREIICVGNDITARKAVERKLARTSGQLRERVKELDCLYAISRLRGRTDFSLDDTLQTIVDLVPPSFQFPKIACARLLLEGYEIATANFRKTDWSMSREVRVGGQKAAELEVGYLEERPAADEGPFLQEERRLIDAVAERIGRIIEREWMEEDMRRLT